MIDLKDLELDNAEPIDFKAYVFNISKPKPITTAEQAEKELYSFTSDYWMTAQLRKRGKSFNDIQKHFNNKYTMSELSYMLDKVVAVNTVMTNRDADILRQQMLMELEELEKVTWGGALIDDNGNTYLDPKHTKTLLMIKDRKIALQGIEPAKKVEVDVNHTITDAREKLTESYDRYFKMKQNAIDVTPSVDKAE